MTIEKGNRFFSNWGTKADSEIFDTEQNIVIL
jgi:hypothetical protein